MNDAAWQAWVEAHHAIGCAERAKPWESCRYRSAHIRTAQEIVRHLEADGWVLRRVTREAESLPLFGGET